MADIFREVDEEVRQDRVQVFLARYWGFLLVAVLVIVGAVGGWRFYDYLKLQKEEIAGGRYLDALNLARENKGPEAITAFDDLSKTGTPGYRLLSRFRAAAQTGLTTPVDGARMFDVIAADGAVEPAMQDVARLRAAALLIDTSDLKTMQQRLDPLADANNGLRNPARELLAIAALKANDNDAAGRWLDAIVADRTATPSGRQRAEALLAVVRSAKTATP